jgi:hypothetical protein
MNWPKAGPGAQAASSASPAANRTELVLIDAFLTRDLLAAGGDPLTHPTENGPVETVAKYSPTRVARPLCAYAPGVSSRILRDRSHSRPERSSKQPSSISGAQTEIPNSGGETGADNGAAVNRGAWSPYRCESLGSVRPAKRSIAPGTRRTSARPGEHGRRRREQRQTRRSAARGDERAQHRKINGAAQERHSARERRRDRP